MDQPALAPDVVRATRTYLSALLPGAEVDDAMHEVVADVSYWHEDDADAVLRMAHAVVAQRSRISDEAAVQALVGEVGITDDDRLGRILSIEPSAARRLRDGVRTKLGSGIPAAADEPVAAPVDVPDRPEPDRPEPDPTAAESVADEAPRSVPDGPVRIGFDEAEVVIPEDGRAGARSVGRSVALGVVIVWVVVAIVLLITQN